MRKFAFRLQRVLKLRKQMEHQKELDLRQATRWLADCTDTSERLAERASEFKQALSGTPEVDTRSAAQLLQLADAQVARMHRLLEEAELQRQQALSALVAASRARELLEKLRKRKLKRFQLEYARALQRELDEAGLLARQARASRK